MSGTEGYAAEADALAARYEDLRFADLHRTVLHLIPSAPCRALDIGAGTGRDAAALAAMGHAVVAAEPVAELRAKAAVLHPSPRIEWLDDALPDLPRLAARGGRFDLVMLTAVWMHLDQNQRRQAMPKVARLVREGGGVAILSLRHGPVPSGRRMFDVSAEETAELAAVDGLGLVLRLDGQADAQRRPGVRWTRLAFRKAAGGG